MNTKVSPVEWVGRLIDRRFPLFEWLGSAESGDLFRTELPGPHAQKAAIRLVPAEIEGAQAQFDDWAQAEGLAHPNLLRIFESGHGRIDENEFLYVVMELPEETLAQVIPTRTLTGPETAEMLPAILDAIGYLHARGMVHGHLTPDNILVAENRVKLSSDTLQQSGCLRKLEGGLRIYDAPEVAQGTILPESDIWSLGITLVEALTQLPPIRNSGTGAPGVPQFMPEPFAEIARQCLRVNPAERATLAEISEALRVPATRTAAIPRTAPVAQTAPVRPAARVPATATAPPVRPVAPSAPQAAASAPVPRPQPPQPVPPVAQAEFAFDEIQPSRRALRSVEEEGAAPRSKISMPVIAGLGALLIVLIAALFIRSHKPQPIAAPDTTASVPANSAPAKAPAPAPARRPSAGRDSNPDAKGAVVDRVMPAVSPRADRTIRGKITVRVRVAVDRDGKVSDASFDSAGPSRYFSNLAMQSARKWRFKPAHVDGRPAPSTWTLRFEFRRGQTDVNPTQVKP